MTSEETKYDTTAGCESNIELNGKASFRSASMISAPRTVQKMRIRGALVPMPKKE
jgi:hypothetical protein